MFDVFFVDSFHRLFALARCFGKTPSSKGSRLFCGAAQPCPSRSGEPNTIVIIYYIYMITFTCFFQSIHAYANVP